MCKQPHRKFRHWPRRALAGLVSLLLGFWFGAGVNATEPESLESPDQLLRAARTFLADLVANDAAGEVRIRIDPIDPRLRLARCDRNPSVELAPGATPRGSTTLRIFCAAPVRWSIFVPARIEFFADVLVATRPLSRGQIVGPSDVGTQRLETSTLHSGYFLDATRVIGQQTRRALTPGQVFTDALITAPLLVQRGQMVTLIVETSSMRVSMQGEALDSGSAGDRVRVRNRSSRRVVEGTIEAPGLVRVP